MRVVIQQRRGQFPNLNYYSAYLGFQELGCEVNLCDEKGIAGLFPADDDLMLVGEIPLMLAAFATLGVGYSPLPYIPTELSHLAGRRLWQSTVGEVRNLVIAGQALFAKPLEGTPCYFKGQVLRTYRDLIRTASCPSDTPVCCSELVEFVSEYRVFVQEGEVVGIKHYNGDFSLFPHWPTIQDALACYQSAPAGFAIDFGITKQGATLLVEQNDGFSLGCYGLHPVIYAKLLAARWDQIVAQRKKVPE